MQALVWLRPVLELADVTLGSAPFDLRIKRAELDLAPLELLRGPLGRCGASDHHRPAAMTAVREESGQVHLEGAGQTAGRRRRCCGQHRRTAGRLRLVDTR